MAFPRINCNTTTVTALTATAATTLSLRVLLVSTTAGTFHNVYFPKQLGTSKPCVTFQDTPHKATSQDRQLRTSKSDVYQQPIEGLILLAMC